LKIDQLIASNVKLEKVHLGVKAAGGKVDAEPLTAELYQGKLGGAASVNANTNQFALKADLLGVALGPLLKDALNNDMLEGKSNIALDVQTAGNTVTVMKKALAGKAKVSLKDGALKGINLDDMIRKAKSAFGGKSAAEQTAQASQRTDLSEFSASFVIKNGVAHNDDLSAKSPLLRLSGAGDVDIGGGSLNYVAKASVVASSGGQGGKDLAELNGLTIPVQISGPFEAPRYRVDFKGIAGNVAKQQAQKVEDKLKERVQDRLKNLLRR
jgi:AsmA protein